MKAIHSFEQLFLVMLCDIYSVEQQVVTLLPTLVKKAQSKELKEVLKDHLQETKLQVTRLEKIFAKLGEVPTATTWIHNVRSLVEKSEKFFMEQTASPVTDAAIIVCIQRIKHDEISAYGSLKEFANVLDYEDIKDFLKETLKEECVADEKLTKIATGGLFKSGVNVLAIKR